MRPTADGLQLLNACGALLAQADEVEQLFRAGQRKAVGRLVVDVLQPYRAPAGRTGAALLRRHPRLELVLGSTDRMVDLWRQEGVDCAVRVGAPAGQQPGGAPGRAAGPDQLRQPGLPGEYGTPRAGGQRVAMSRSATPMRSPAGRCPGSTAAMDQTVTVSMPSRVVANNAETYIACCLAGIGLIQIPRFDVQDLLDRGELVEVLPQHRAAPMPLSLVYPHRRHPRASMPSSSNGSRR